MPTLKSVQMNKFAHKLKFVLMSKYAQLKKSVSRGKKWVQLIQMELMGLKSANMERKSAKYK